MAAFLYGCVEKTLVSTDILHNKRTIYIGLNKMDEIHDVFP